jgi:ArsR family transcriptional regulator, cadmium/lead-responsive transcriptional repressor
MKKVGRSTSTAVMSSREELNGAVSLFHSLADPTRLAIVQCLVIGERRVVDLTQELDLPQSTVSSHLACLRDCQLIVARPEGRQMFYSLAHVGLLDLLKAAEQLLADTGEAVALCPTYGVSPTKNRAGKR